MVNSRPLTRHKEVKAAYKNTTKGLIAPPAQFQLTRMYHHRHREEADWLLAEAQLRACSKANTKEHQGQKN